MRALSPGPSCVDELLRRLLHQFEVAPHAGAPIEHHHNRDGLDFVCKHGELLRFAVVVDLKVFTFQIGNQPTSGIRDRRVDGDRPHDVLERGLLKSGSADT